MGKSFVDAIYSKLLTANEIFQPCPWCAARCCDGILISSGNRPGWNPHRKANYTMTYHIESDSLGYWLKFINGSLQYCKGYLDARRHEGPRPAFRIVSETGRVVETLDRCEEVYIGQVVHFPTAEQYERAGAKAFEKANAIRVRSREIEEWEKAQEPTP